MCNVSMRDYKDQLEDLIRNDGLFAEYEPSSMSKDKDKIIDFSINDLLRPEWQKARINDRLTSCTEDVLINGIVDAVDHILIDYCGFSCEKEVRESIANKIEEWHNSYCVQFE